MLVGSGVLDRAPLRFGAAPARVEAYSSLRPAASYGRAGEARAAGGADAAPAPRAARPEALYGYEAARLVLDAVRQGGSRRPAVVRAALRPRLALVPGRGTFEINRSGRRRRARRLTLYRLEDGVFRALVEPG